NRISLNKVERQKELDAEDKLQDARNAERRERFSKITAQDKGTMKFMKLTLDDVAKPGLREYDPSAENAEYMRRAKDENADLDDTPKWPSGMDPVKRESLHILRDLIHMTESARTAGLLRKTN